MAHHPLEPDPVRGIEGFRKLLQTLFAAFSDWTLTIEDLVAEEDVVAARLTSRGTQSGELAGYPPSGNDFTAGEMWLLRFDGGKATELWLMPDMFSLMRELGLVPDGPPPKPVLKVMGLVGRIAPSKDGAKGPTPEEVGAHRGPPPARVQKAEGRKATVRDAIEYLNARDFDTGERYFEPGLVVHHPTEREPIQRVAGFRKLIDTAVAGFSDWHLGLADVVGEGDVVIARFVSSGTHDGEFVGFPATDRCFAVPEMMGFHFSGDQIGEMWVIPDLTRHMGQLRLMPPGPPPKPMLMMMRWMQRREERKGKPA